MSLATITAVSLPPQVYAHNTTHDVALAADSARFRPIASTHGWVKPKPGTGLWTATVTGRDGSGQPADSGWLEYRRDEMCSDTTGTLLTEILPTRDARILLVDSHQHLIDLVAAFPAPYEWGYRTEQKYPDWPALAAAGWDAVYLTDRGQWATRFPDSGPDLYGWDLESVLWLRHSYTVGTTTISAPAREAVTT
ncbi:hypothetical protein OG369_42475 [Streptomyces sp. NBC_01221]|uniref:hypothetical protein n=1 Tax=Streptomyces sp. NBC_01221 TaxID=2903782 RepID=UPI00225AF927|nr:hypothetical protein [Streptomyces sp. NBC_01221]MCX4792445.1 hypothetical protein [Streptomyces sp. NBC_01221]